MRRRLLPLLCLIIVLLPTFAGAGEPAAGSLFFDPCDGAFDIAAWLLSPRGFLPLPLVITEPAVKYGGGLSLLFFHNSEEKLSRGITPDITGGAFFLTGNLTIGGGAFHLGFWKDDTIRFIGGLFRSSLNIDLFVPLPSNPSLAYNFDAWIGMSEATFRLGSTSLWLGPRIVGFLSDTSAMANPDHSFEMQTNYLTFGPVFTRDTRDSNFTPTEGHRLDLSAMFALPLPWDVDAAFFPIALVSIMYRTPVDWIVFGDRLVVGTALWNVPGYGRAGIIMRGVPAGSSQGDLTLQWEPELRFRVTERWDVMVFGGAGLALNGFSPGETIEFTSADFVFAGGTGFRYQIARELKLSIGLDAAVSNRGWAVSVVMGNAWR